MLFAMVGSISTRTRDTNRFVQPPRPSVPSSDHRRTIAVPVTNPARQPAVPPVPHSLFLSTDRVAKRRQASPSVAIVGQRARALLEILENAGRRRKSSEPFIPIDGTKTTTTSTSDWQPVASLVTKDRSASLGEPTNQRTNQRTYQRTNRRASERNG